MYRYLIYAILISIVALSSKSHALETSTITSNVIATESARGTVARNIAKDFSEGSPDVEKILYDNFMQVRVEVEKLLEHNGFASQDVGVAYGVYFVTLWELANNKDLPEGQAVKYWTTHLHELNISSDTLDAKKDQFYDFLLHTPVILVALKEAAKQINNQELLEVIPQAASELFMFLTKYPAPIVLIQSDGSMKADKAKTEQFLMVDREAEVRRFLQVDMSQPKIDTFLKKRKKPKKNRLEKPQKKVILTTTSEKLTTA